MSDELFYLPLPNCQAFSHAVVLVCVIFVDLFLFVHLLFFTGELSVLYVLLLAFMTVFYWCGLCLKYFKNFNFKVKISVNWHEY